jgi:hypothetical protein
MRQFSTQLDHAAPATRTGSRAIQPEVYLMIRKKLGTIALLLTPALLLVALSFASAGAHPSASRGWSDRDRTCVPVGGTILTNFGAISSTTTLGPATGDLRGAVAASLQGSPVTSGSNVLFSVLHHWVTDSGDTIFFDVATAKTVPLSQTRFAIVDYPVHIKGGTGKFAGATGDLNNLGEVDLNDGNVLRYFGKVCYDHDN